MRRYIVNRLLQSIPVLILVSLLVFLLVRLIPNDPIYAILGPDSEGFSPAQHAAMMRKYGLDRPLPLQYLTWVKGMLTGNWGTDYDTGQPVATELGHRIPYTLELATASFLISVVLGMVGGIVAALNRNSIWDVLATSGAMFGVAIPNFWFALMMILLFGVTLHLLPTFGGVLVWQHPVAGFRDLVLPATALGLAGAGTLMRQCRSSMLETMSEDFIRTARAKGVMERHVVWSHALRNSLLPVVTILGLRVGRILGGAVIIETMFSWPGVGRLSVLALERSDYPVIEAVVILSAVAIVLANLLTDVTYAYLDPRIRYA